jgi:hypothetical protein
MILFSLVGSLFFYGVYILYTRWQGRDHTIQKSRREVILPDIGSIDYESDLLKSIRELLGISHREKYPLADTPSEIGEYEKNPELNTIIGTLEMSEYQGVPLDRDAQKKIDIQIRTIFASYF